MQVPPAFRPIGHARLAKRPAPAERSRCTRPELRFLKREPAKASSSPARRREQLLTSCHIHAPLRNLLTSTIGCDLVTAWRKDTWFPPVPIPPLPTGGGSGGIYG